MTREEILKEAMWRWGEAAQTDMCIEEMSELTKALLKVRRLHASELGGAEHAKRVADVREEIADVRIMLAQMCILYGDPAAEEESKLKRLEGRLQAASSTDGGEGERRKENARARKLKALNAIEVEDSSCSNGECEYVTAAFTIENIKTLLDGGFSVAEIEQAAGEDNDYIDLSTLAFQYAAADWFENGNGFR